jgi:hypothetical protein
MIRSELGVIKVGSSLSPKSYRDRLILSATIATVLEKALAEEKTAIDG